MSKIEAKKSSGAVQTTDQCYYSIYDLTELLCLMLTGSGVEAMKLKAARDHILVPLFQSTIFLKRYLVFFDMWW